MWKKNNWSILIEKEKCCPEEFIKILKYISISSSAMIFLQMHKKAFTISSDDVWFFMVPREIDQTFSPRHTFCIFAYSDWMVTLLSLHRPNSLYFPFLGNFTNSSNLPKTHKPFMS